MTIDEIRNFIEDGNDQCLPMYLICEILCAIDEIREETDEEIPAEIAEWYDHMSNDFLEYEHYHIHAMMEA